MNGAITTSNPMCKAALLTPAWLSSPSNTSHTHLHRYQCGLQDGAQPGKLNSRRLLFKARSSSTIKAGHLPGAVQQHKAEYKVNDAGGHPGQNIMLQISEPTVLKLQG